MQELVNVDIEDVYPYEDPEGNSLNPRDFSTPESAEYIATLGEQFRYNKLNPGQPRVKPILYRDGGIYWIIDGECRYRAMKAIGTKRFLAEVYDDVADAETARAEAAKAMVETDCKLNLTAAEMSRGVQTMLSLDIPDDEVAAVARIEPEKVRRARRGARRVADAAYDMTLDRLMAIAEFDGDEEAVAELRDCSQGEWADVYRRLSDEKERADALAAAERELAAAGVPRVDDRLDGGRRCVANVLVDRRAAERVRGELDGGAVGAYAVEGNWIALLRDETDEERGMAAAAREREAAEEVRGQRDREMWEVEGDARLEWLAGRIADPKSMRNAAGVLAGVAADSVSALLSELDAGVDMSPTPALCAIGWGLTWFPEPWVGAHLAEGRALPWEVRSDRARGLLALHDAMVRDGYEPGEVMVAAAETLRAFLGGGESDGE